MKHPANDCVTDREATEGGSADLATDEGLRQLLQRLADLGALPDGVLLVLIGEDDCDVRLSVLQQDPVKAQAVLERLKLAVDATLGEMVSPQGGS